MSPTAPTASRRTTAPLVIPAPDTTPNRFLHGRDWNDPRYARLREEFDRFYRDEMGGSPHSSHAKHPERIVTHWSREWEYPWTVLNMRPAAGMRVTDLGCGGSPLLPYLGARHGCVGAGVDPVLRSTTGGQTLRGFPREPEEIYPAITWLRRSMAETGLPDASQERVLCISVLEHVTPQTARATMREIRRLLVPGGLALITTDVGGDHRTLTIGYREIITMGEEAGLVLDGPHDWTEPPPDDVPGTYHVVGFVLKKG